MSAPGKAPASSSGASRWGSFLTSAVAGMESRLDNMLGEFEDGQGGQAQAQAQAQNQSATKSAAPAAQQANLSKPSPSTSRTSSTNRANDRLQARLAKAMAGKNAPSAGSSPRTSVDQASRSSVDQPPSEREQVEASTGNGSSPAAPADITSTVANTTEATAPAITIDDAGEGKDTAPSAEGIKEVDKAAAQSDVSAPTDTAPSEPAEETSREDRATAVSPPDQKENMVQLAKDMDEIKTRQQEEIQEYIERIDSLQSKLQYMSKNAAESAKKDASAAPSGSAERKLAEKDEKIALLMEEGQKLAGTEHKLRTVIKKLRTQMADTEKQMNSLREANTKALADAQTLRSRLDGSEEKEKQQEEVRRTTAALQKEIDSLRKQNTEKSDALRRQEQDAKSKAEQAAKDHSAALDKALAAERKTQKDLEENIATLQAEKESLAEQGRQDTSDWKEKHERAVERGTKIENELKNELSAMEGKLENMRSAAEEASSGTGGEAQVKLLRQIETLQSQYASASSNWQGIETSLLAKISGLEKERDEAQRRESEMRKKARDAASRNRNLEEELEDLQPAYAAAQKELDTCREQLSSLRLSSKGTETALEQARADLEKQQRLATKDENEDAARRQWVEDVAGVNSSNSKGNHHRPDSPQLPISRTFSSDLMGSSLYGRSKRAVTPGSVPDLSIEALSQGRRLSMQPPPSSRANASPPIGSRTNSAVFPPFEPPPTESIRTPSIVAEQDDGINETPSSPRNVAQDMVSASTVAAGPSVQLVERMSAAIRRLEAEKVAAKEEMARVCSQRDEARADMVGLMKELEDAKTSSTRVGELEGEVADLNSRYQTTLEMLGEKSERVEELQADVDDVKAMYRELVERTVK